MQKPPLFSALRIDGKKLYEYARDGEEPPKEIEQRPVEVEDLVLVEWLEGGTHNYHYPVAEIEGQEKVIAQKILNIEDTQGAGPVTTNEDAMSGGKRKRDGSADGPVPDHPSPKRQKASPEVSEPAASGDGSPETSQEISESLRMQQRLASKYDKPEGSRSSSAPCPAPAVRLRMTVTSGFYVRSLAHDLGAAVGSLGFMAALVRSRQERFELGKNVLEFDDIHKGEEVWGPKLEQMLKDWNASKSGPSALG